MSESPIAPKFAFPYVKLLVNVLLLIGVCIVCIAVVELFQEGKTSLARLSLTHIALLVLMQCMVCLVLIVCWRRVIFACGGRPVVFRDALVQVSFLLIGKYLPGKVWGLLGRHYIARQGGYSDRLLVHASLTDQFLLIYSGCAMGSCAFSLTFSWFGWEKLLVFLFVVPLLSPSIFNGFVGMLSRGMNRIPYLKDRLSLDDSMPRLSASNYYRLLFLYCLLWIGFAAVTWFLAYALGHDLSLRSGIVIGGAFILAFNAGFLFLLAPGGIGVRESAFVFLAAPIVGLQPALTMALLHRLLFIFQDVTVGVIGFVLFQKLRRKNGIGD